MQVCEWNTSGAPLPSFSSPLHSEVLFLPFSFDSKNRRHGTAENELDGTALKVKPQNARRSIARAHGLHIHNIFEATLGPVAPVFYTLEINVDPVFRS